VGFGVDGWVVDWVPLGLFWSDWFALAIAIVVIYQCHGDIPSHNTFSHTIPRKSKGVANYRDLGNFNELSKS
jgi:hypothetical protein